MKKSLQRGSIAILLMVIIAATSAGGLFFSQSVRPKQLQHKAEGIFNNQVSYLDAYHRQHGVYPNSLIPASVRATLPDSVKCRVPYFSSSYFESFEYRPVGVTDSGAVSCTFTVKLNDGTWMEWTPNGFRTWPDKTPAPAGVAQKE